MILIICSYVCQRSLDFEKLHIEVFHASLFHCVYMILLVMDVSVLVRDGWMDGWMNGVLGHFFALSRLNWAGDNLG